MGPLQRHKDGVGSVTFAEAEEADQCVQSMNERYFQKRQVFVETWDGKTKFKASQVCNRAAFDCVRNDYSLFRF